MTNHIDEEESSNEGEESLPLPNLSTQIRSRDQTNNPLSLFNSNVSQSHVPLNNQLTLAFHGEDYVFDSVSPKKVQAVLLLLGGYEVPTGVHNPVMTPQNNKMQRKKGQFTSCKSISDEAASSSVDWDGQEEQETVCMHCQTSSKDTPMMRRGPNGPRTLCNACGLKWANKGVLRDVPKVPSLGIQHHSMKLNVNGERTMVSNVNIATSSDGDN